MQPPLKIRNLYRDSDELIAVAESGQLVELGDVTRSFYARPHPALESCSVEDAPGGWLRVEQSYRSAQLRDVVERWRKRGVDPKEADVKPVDRALADLRLEISDQISFAFIDLECLEPSADALRNRDYAQFQIISFAYRTSDNKRGFVRAEAATPQAETALLCKLATIFRRYDVILAWNGGREWGDGKRPGDGFDFPVIRARCKALGINPIDWWRSMVIDQMDLYLKKFLSTTDGGQRASLALDAVAKANGLAGKVGIKARLREMGIEPGAAGIRASYEHAPDLLREYNLGDVDAQWEIEQKTGFLAMHLATCRLVGMLPRSDSLTPSRTMDALMLRLGYRSGYHWPTRIRGKDDDETHGKIRGAVVKEGEPGLYTDLAVLDVGSLYPSIIRALNLGPDTKRKDGPIRPIMSSATGVPTDEVIACFAGHDEPGQIPKALELMLAKRAEYDKLVETAEVGSAQHGDYRRLSAACKAVNNSFYGLILQPGSRFYDPDVGAAVTSTGRFAIHEIVELIEAHGYPVKIQDTDSAGFECADQAIPGEIADEINDEMFPDMMAQIGVPREVTGKILKIKHEETYSRLLIVRTKGYAGFFSRYKGQVVAEGNEVLDLKGLETVKGSTIKAARDLQRDLVLAVLRGDAPGDVRTKVDAARERFLGDDLVLAEVITHTKISKALDEYKSITPAVRVAREYEAIGLDREGGKVRYWFARGEQPRMADEWDAAQVDRAWYWDKHIWPPSQRVLEAAWPEQNWDLSTGPKQEGIFGAQPSKRGKRRRVDQVPDEVVVRIEVPPTDERTPATEIRDKLRINAVRRVADENPGDVPLVIVMVVAAQYETRLETPLKINPAAREAVRRAGIIQATNLNLFDDGGNDDDAKKTSGRGRTSRRRGAA